MTFKKFMSLSLTVLIFTAFGLALVGAVMLGIAVDIQNTVVWGVLTLLASGTALLMLDIKSKF